MTAGQSHTKNRRGLHTEQRRGRVRPDRKKLLALHFRLVAPRRANLRPKCEGADLVGLRGFGRLSALCHDMMSCHNSLRGANELSRGRGKRKETRGGGRREEARRRGGEEAHTELEQEMWG